MPHLKTASSFGACLLAILLVPGITAQEDERGQTVIRWPDARYETLQAAIDAAPAGATIRIAAGEHRISRPLYVRRSLRFRGAGSGQRDGRGVTHLIGPAPQPVVDERGTVVLPADSVQGLFNVIGNVIGTNVEFSAMWLSGFDAGIAATDARSRVSLRAIDLVISDTGRGIVVLAPGFVSVRRSRIENTSWNGISVAPASEHAPGSLFVMSDNLLLKATNVGAYFANTAAYLLNQTVDDNACGGIVGINSSGASIIGSTITNNGHVGILLREPQGYSVINDNDVMNTWTTFCQVGGVTDGGDGIAIIHSQTPGESNPVWVIDNTVNSNARAGLGNFGSRIALGGKAFSCNAFDLEGEAYLAGGFVYQFLDVGPDNLPSPIGCGCPLPTGTCIVESAAMPPPEPLTVP